MRHGRLAVRVALAAFSLCAIASAETFTYWNGNERRDLTPVPGMAAIYLGNETPAALEQFNVITVGGGWYVVRSAGDGVKLADSMLSIPQVKFSSPIFKGQFFGYQWLKPSTNVVLKTVAPANAAALMGPVPAISANLLPKPEGVSSTISVANPQLAAHIVKFGLNTRSFREVLEVTNSYRTNSNVASSTPGSFMSAKTRLNPNDPLFPAQWYHNNTGQFGGNPVDFIDMKGADSFNFGFSNASVQVLVLDDGVDQNHEDYSVGFGSDWTDSGTFGAPNDPDNETHGTAMAGLIGATANNGRGIAGMGAGSTIASAKVLLFIPFFGYVTDPEWIQNGLIWGAQKQLRLSATGFNLGAADALIDQGYGIASAFSMTHFAPVGAGGAVAYPATLANVIAIGGTDWVRSATGTTGEKTLVVGAADGIFTTFPNNGYGAYPEFGFATSAATALVTGVAANMLSKNPALTSIDFQNILAGTAEDIVDPQQTDQKVGFDNTWGWGMVNAGYAVPGAGMVSITANQTEFFGGEQGTARFTLLFDPVIQDVILNPSSTDPATLDIGSDPIIYAAGDPKTQGVNFTTSGVSDVRTVRISAQINNTIRAFNITIKPAILSSIEIPGTINSFAAVNGRVRLQGSAPVETAVVSLTSNRPSVLNVPATVTLTSQQNNRTFPATAGQVSANTEVVVTASYRGLTRTKKTIVVPPTAILASVTATPSSIEGGQNFSATVRIAAPVANNVLVNLTENSPVVNAPTSARLIPAGQTSTVFTVGTGEVTTPTGAVLTANLGAQTRTVNLTVTPTRKVVSMVCNPLSVRQGFSTTMRIIVFSPAPTGGTVVTLSDNSVYATTPATVTIPAGRSFIDVTIPTASTVPSTQTVTITGRVGTTATQTATFSITR
jgi:hypothetical protein